MKNIFSFSNFSQTAKGGIFLFKIEQKEETIQSPKIREIIEKSDLTFNTQKELLKNQIAISNDKNKLPRNSRKNDIADIDKTEKIENNRKWGDPEKMSQKEIDMEVKEHFSRVLSNDPGFNNILNNKEQTYTEMSKSLSNYAELPEVQHKFKEHLMLIPKDWHNNAKVGSILATIGFISHDGTTWESGKKAATWGIIGAVLTHPVVTGAVAHSANFLGKKVAAPALMASTNLITNLVDNPKLLLQTLTESFKDGKYKDPANTPIWKLLRHNTTVEADLGKALSSSLNPIYLQDKGMKFSPELDGVISFMKNYEDGKSSPQSSMTNVNNAAKFVAQTRELHISDEDLDKFRGKLWNNENLPTSQRRQMVATALRNKINDFFNSKEELKTPFQMKLEEARQNKDLPQLKTKDLEKMIGKGQNFSKLDKKLPHGIRRMLKNPTGSVLIFYILTFLLAKGAMVGSSIASGAWKKTENIRENKLKTLKKVAWSPFRAVWAGLVRLGRGGKSMAASRRKEVLKIGKDKNKGNWTKSQVDAYDKLSKDEQDKVADKFFKKVEEKEESLQKKLKGMEKAAKDKKDPVWKIWKAFSNRKITKDMKDSDDFKNAQADLKKITSFDDDEWRGAFSTIDAEKAKHILSPNP